MKENNEEDDYRNSTTWGLIFIGMFFLLILVAIWAVMTGNYNTP
ncbi:MAG: hypothetical protein ABJF04_24345 [Reichenbachiella sp.]